MSMRLPEPSLGAGWVTIVIEALVLLGGKYL
jgi:hypothetical protein